MTDRELMQAVLEAMEDLHRTGDTQVFDLYAAPELIPALRERLAHCDRCDKPLGGPDHVHTCTPQPRQWVGLTDDEIDDLYQGAGKNDLKRAREIEAKLKEKNT